MEAVLGRDRVRRRFPLLTPEHVETFLRGLRVKAHVVAEVPKVYSYSRDPDDEPILNLAIATGAQYLVTRDKDLLDLMREDDPGGTAFRPHCPGSTYRGPCQALGRPQPGSR